MNADELTPIEQIAYEAIEEITETKRDSVDPCVAHINEIRNSINIELMEALRELCRRGILSVSLDIGKNPMFTIKRNL